MQGMGGNPMMVQQRMQMQGAQMGQMGQMNPNMQQRMMRPGVQVQGMYCVTQCGTYRTMSHNLISRNICFSESRWTSTNPTTASTTTISTTKNAWRHDAHEPTTDGRPSGSKGTPTGRLFEKHAQLTLGHF